MRQTEVKTKKPHRCYACNRTFPAGSRMIDWVSIYEGEFCSGYTCMTCNRIMDLSSESEFPQDCVSDALSFGQTPEDMLNEMYNDLANKQKMKV